MKENHINEKKVADMKEQIKIGTFKINSEKIAIKIIKEIEIKKR